MEPDIETNHQNHRCIHQLFEAQVECTPDNIAFIFANETLTYRQLNRYANQLAHYLRRAGIGPDALVGLCVDRSPAMVISILAILKAGGAYVPLEPAVPKPRLLDILKDTQPCFLILQDHLDVFDDYAGQKIIFDEVATNLAGAPISNLPCLTTPANLLNVVYTSASTGKPKGVLIPMSAVLNRLFWMWDDYPFRAGDVVAFHKSYALVAATWECFGGLLKGIPTLVLTRQDVLDPAVLWRKLVAHRVSYLTAMPSLLQGILDQAERQSDHWTSLRLSTTSAEPISPALARRWCAMFPGVPLLNLYGSTECSSNVTVYDAQSLPPQASCVPIGKPFANNHVYILDDEFKSVPIGEIGEMCVTGACLARGYHNLPELTAEKFIDASVFRCAGVGEQSSTEDPTMGRLYRTGDLARFQPDGTIELVGRKDNQVKIRGFRVELEDIEATLLEHEAVRECAVSLRHDPGLGDYLAAYVVLRGETTASALRRFLQERLPEYMIPTLVARLETLPQTVNGKLDRKKLPQADECWSQIESDYAAPRNALERAVCQLLQETLNIERVGIEDYFLDLGLHSLLMIQLRDKLSRRVEREIPITALLQYGTVRTLSEYLGQASPEQINPIAHNRRRAEKRRAMRHGR
jgi:surfactin family lipopeptide synthetase A